jgi:hypothetical protein
MDIIDEAVTNHDDHGRFCNLNGARTVVKDGVRHLVIGQYNRTTGKVKRHPRRKPRSKTEAVFDHVDRGRYLAKRLVDTRRMAIPMGDLFGE